MRNEFYRPGDSSGFQYERHNTDNRENYGSRETMGRKQEKDEELIIEENTIYEIDRECYERLKKHNKRRY